MAPAPQGAAWATVCGNRPVLTPLATDTSSHRTLFSLRGAPPEDGGSAVDWLVVVDLAARTARLHPDPLAHLRTAASHGPGPFMAASRCGDDCFQPLRWTGAGWRPVGYPIEFEPRSTLHFTHDRSGTPWLVFHRLTERKGVLAATAYRWDGERWTPQGRLPVQGVGSPGATADPDDPRAILSGTGRFAADRPPRYWVPALPVLPPVASGALEGGHVVALPGGGALFLTFDGRIATSDDGANWRLERWTPWPNPLRRSDLWTPGTDYSIDRPVGSAADPLRLLWYDERRREAPLLHLTRWSREQGWVRDATLDLRDRAAASAEHVLHSGTEWALLGECTEKPAGSALSALMVNAHGETETIDLRLVPAGG